MEPGPAHDYLAEALARGDAYMRRWARRDPALQGLADDERFAELTAEPQPPAEEKAPPLLRALRALFEWSVTT